METDFEALEVALTKGQSKVARELLRKLRACCEAPAAFDAAAECGMIELGGSREPEAIARFIHTIRGAFDPDCDA